MESESVIAWNFNRDPTYCPYCMRCRGLQRMTLVEPLLWKHSCGAIHDERPINSGGVES